MAVATDTLERVALAALAEDVGEGDVTTDATVDADATGSADVVVKEPGVVCGLDVAEAVLRTVDPDLRFERLVDEGAIVAAGTAVARVEWSARAILTGERTVFGSIYVRHDREHADNGQRDCGDESQHFPVHNFTS